MLLKHDSFSQYPTRTEAEDGIRAALPPRKKDSHKGDFGRAALVCGSSLYAGAAILAAEGTLRMGAGFTYLYSVREVVAAARARLPEVICREMPPASEGLYHYLPYLAAADAILLGCGIGQEGDGEAFCAALSSLLSEDGGTVVLDADALNLLSRHGAREILRGARRAVILTPHEMEFSRLSELSLAEIRADRVGCACRFARDTGAVVLLKGAGSVIARQDGSYSVCPSGSPALSKGGTGDVLAGMLAGLLTQGLSPADAAFVAAYLHGKAGETLADRYSERGILPSELPVRAAEILCDVLKYNAENNT